MNNSFLFKFALIISLACVGWAAPARNSGDTGDSDESGKQFATVIVNGRTLTGPNSSAQRLDGRILIPIASVARSLGDAVAVNPAARAVSVRRQTGVTADFDIRLGQVRENGSLVLTVSNTGEIILSPNAGELMLPAEIVSALLDVSIRYDADKNAVIVSRGAGQMAAPESAKDQRPFDIYQADYEYSLNRYSPGSLQNLTLKLAGRLADGRFTFLSNSTGTSLRDISMQTGTFTLERPNGQRFVAGDLGTGANLQFLSATVRGGSASIPVSKAIVTAFAGRTYSGVVPFVDPLLQPPTAPPQHPFRSRFRYDTDVFGFFAATNSANNGRGTNRLGFSAGAMRFAGADRSGDLVSGGASYDVSRFRLQGEFGYGKFTGLRAAGSRFSGTGAAVDLSATFQVTDNLALQGRYTNIGKNFLGPQSGLREPLVLKAVGVTWSPRSWLSTSFNASSARRPGENAGDSRFVTASFAVTPRPGLPRFYLTHTQSSTSQIRSAAFTMLTASKEFSRLRVFLNATRIKLAGPAAMNLQLGANYRVNDSNSLEVTQGLGNSGAWSGQFDWRTSGLLKDRLSFSAGAGYDYGKMSKVSTFERFSLSLTLPRQTSLQVNYVQSGGGPTLLISVRGTLFRRRQGQAFLDSPAAEMNSYGKLSGRVYQDVDLNGRYDAGVDKPQAEVKIRVDGNRYVVSDENGLYSLDSVNAGDHRLYLDLLSVRADLTFLDEANKNITLLAGRSSVFDFRLVRTGRISGRVWLDANENGKLDEGEKPLADIRVVTASGRDTLTDSDGYFVIGDLPPGDHVILLDEKTLPEKTMAESKPQAARAFPGRETANVMLPVTIIPAEVKRFAARAEK